MNLESRLAALRNRHAQLDEQILQEQARPLPNSQTLSRMKLDKLYLKEEIARISDA